VVKKNPHAVALGRLGGRAGGPARAKALGTKRRREIAKKGGIARASALSAASRSRLAASAARARWAKKASPTTAADAPEAVRRLLKSYRPSDLKWVDPHDRYVVVREVLLGGDPAAARWLANVLHRHEVRALVRRFAGAGVNEPGRKKLRKALNLSTADIPRRPYLGFLWRPQT
jgi:hypothetical protein